MIKFYRNVYFDFSDTTILHLKTAHFSGSQTEGELNMTAQDNQKPDPDYLDRLVNEHEAAEYLGYSVRALQNWRVRGGGPVFVKVSARSIRYRRRDLQAWVEAHLQSNTSTPATQAA